MCNISNSAINNFTLPLPSDASHSRPSTRDEKRADFPWAVYRGLMKSQMRIGSPTDSPALKTPGSFITNPYAPSRLLSEIPHREPSAVTVIPATANQKQTKRFICPSACRFFWNSIHAASSIHLLLHFFQVCFTWKWKFWLGATEPDKSPSAKKKWKRGNLCTGPEKNCPSLSSLWKWILRRNLKRKWALLTTYTDKVWKTSTGLFEDPPCTRI